MTTDTKATTRISKRGKSLVVESTRRPTIKDVQDLFTENVERNNLMESLNESLKAKTKSIAKNGEKPLQQRGQFIQLRAEGLSFAKIAKKLKVSKPTLLKWQVELAKEIQQARFFAIESLVEEYKLRKQHRIQQLAIVLNKAEQELLKRDFSELSTADLLKVVERLEGKLSKELQSVSCATGETTSVFEEDHFTQEVRIHVD